MYMDDSFNSREPEHCTRVGISLFLSSRGEAFEEDILTVKCVGRASGEREKRNGMTGRRDISLFSHYEKACASYMAVYGKTLCVSVRRHAAHYKRRPPALCLKCHMICIQAEGYERTAGKLGHQHQHQK